MDNITDLAYSRMVKGASPPSRSVRNFFMSFLVGGAICAFGQGLIRLYLKLGLSEEVAFPAASITLVFLAALATGLNIFDRLAKHAGGGTLVPITGFSNAMTAAALEFKSEGYVLGLGAKLFTIAGPVIVYGVASGIIYGLVLYLFKLY